MRFEIIDGEVHLHHCHFCGYEQRSDSENVPDGWPCIIAEDGDVIPFHQTSCLVAYAMEHFTPIDKDHLPDIARQMMRNAEDKDAVLYLAELDAKIGKVELNTQSEYLHAISTFGSEAAVTLASKLKLLGLEPQRPRAMVEELQ